MNLRGDGQHGVAGVAREHHLPIVYVANLSMQENSGFLVHLHSLTPSMNQIFFVWVVSRLSVRTTPGVRSCGWTRLVHVEKRVAALFARVFLRWRTRYSLKGSDHVQNKYPFLGSKQATSNVEQATWACVVLRGECQKRSFLALPADERKPLKILVPQTLGKTFVGFVAFLAVPQRANIRAQRSIWCIAQTCKPAVSLKLNPCPAIPPSAPPRSGPLRGRG